MKIRPWAKFTTDLPDDQIENGEQIVRFAGENVANAIADMLIRCGCKVSRPIYAHEHGWELDIIAGRERRRLWCQITLINKYWIVFKQNSWISNAFGRTHQTYIDALMCLGMALMKDTRFHDVRWYASDELDSQASGASLPV